MIHHRARETLAGGNKELSSSVISGHNTRIAKQLLILIPDCRQVIRVIPLALL